MWTGDYVMGGRSVVGLRSTLIRSEEPAAPGSSGKPRASSVPGEYDGVPRVQPPEFFHWRHAEGS